MDRAQMEHLCIACGLGALRAESQAVTGGLLHRVWHLRTDKGSFAVKQLHPAIMQKPGIWETYRLSERIASELAARGVPAVTALPDLSGEVLHNVDGVAFIIYPWVEGEILTPPLVDSAHAHQIGAILAHIHELQLAVPELMPSEWQHFNDDDWDILTYQAADMNLPWAYPVRAAMPRLLEWTRAYESAGQAFTQPLVISHTDLDLTNVIWANKQTPMLVDWEAVSWINPMVELVNVALSWGGVTTGTVREDIFQATLDGYCQAGGVLQDAGIYAIYGCMGIWLGWLLFNMRRSLGESVASEEEQKLGIRETTNTLATLRTMASNAEAWAARVDARKKL